MGLLRKKTPLTPKSPEEQWEVRVKRMSTHGLFEGSFLALSGMGRSLETAQGSSGDSDAHLYSALKDAEAITHMLRELALRASGVVVDRF